MFVSSTSCISLFSWGFVVGLQWELKSLNYVKLYILDKLLIGIGMLGVAV